MHRAFTLSALTYLLLLSSALAIQVVTSGSGQYSRLSSQESEVISRINGTSAYNYDLELEKIGLNHSLSNYSFRSSGSTGANETAKWIKNQFESFGLETHMESFEFTTWNVLTEPLLVIDEDGNQSTTDDQVTIESFQPDHYSWPTPAGGVFANVVTLPLPEALSREMVGARGLDASVWLAVNTTGKILLIGREVRWAQAWHLAFWDKLKTQTPAAVIFSWSYDWMSWAPPSYPSTGGRPATSWGPYFWDLKIPEGWVSYEDALWMRNRLRNNTKLYANVTVDAVIESGPHYNVIGQLRGSGNPDKMIIISGHYDTVVTAGFCDNGAGTAGVVELARVFSQAVRDNVYKPDQTLLFIAFAAEELCLVGSMNYMKQHEAELSNITAVINLDCIGNRNFEITETFSDDKGLNLKDIVSKSAEDLGIPVIVIDPESGGSDQESFRNPMGINSEYHLFWGEYAGIANMTRVKSSIMIDSEPLFYHDRWTTGISGWIHTPYDNSTSTQTLDWVSVDRLGNHIQVVGLSVMRVLSAMSNPISLQLVGAVVVAGVVVTAIIYFERSRVSAFFAKVLAEVRTHIEERELLYIIMLTAIFLFISYISFSATGKIEVIIQGFPETRTMHYFGAPFKMIGVEFSTQPPVGEGGEGSVSPMPAVQGNTVVLWQGLILNAALFFLLAFIITYSVKKMNYIHARAKLLKA